MNIMNKICCYQAKPETSMKAAVQPVSQVSSKPATFIPVDRNPDIQVRLFALRIRNNKPQGAKIRCYLM